MTRAFQKNEQNVLIFGFGRGDGHFDTRKKAQIGSVFDAIVDAFVDWTVSVSPVPIVTVGAM